MPDPKREISLPNIERQLNIVNRQLLGESPESIFPPFLPELPPRSPNRSDKMPEQDNTQS